MSGFYWTSLEVGTVAVVTAVLAALAWMRVEKRRDERESVLDRLVWIPGGPLTDERVDAEFAGLLPEVEPGLKAALYEENAALLDEYASECPMRQRPSAPAAEPGEPWQLRRGDADDFPAGLVERADLTDTLDGETR